MSGPGTVLVCFACRRRIAPRDADATCPDCGGPTRSLSARLPLPPRDNVRGWEALREVCDAD